MIIGAVKMRRGAQGTWPGHATRSKIAAAVFTVACSALLFWLAGRDSPFVVIDSGPYLSMAHNLSTRGELVSSFNFVGNFDRLPGPPNFIPPGFSALVALARLVVGSEIAAAKCVLFLSLALVQWLAVVLLSRRTGSVPFAMVVSVLLVWNTKIASHAAMILTDVPFLACLLAATLAAVAVLDDRGGRGARWIGLPVASALLVLVRYLGVFFPVVFSIVHLVGTIRRRDRVRGELLYLLFYNAVAIGPTVIWMFAARSASPAFLPDRPDSLLSLGDALTGAALYSAVWLGPWIALTVVGWVVVRLLRGAPVEASARPDRTDWFLVWIALAYLVVLIAVRTGNALYPLEELGFRYAVPVWPPLFLFVAVVFYRLVWSRRVVAVNAVAIAAALAIFWFHHREVVAFRLDPAVPTQAETYRNVVDHVSRDAVVVSNLGQTLCVERPDLKVIGIPSRLDFNYDLDLTRTVARFDVGWLVLFSHTGMAEMYPEEVLEWMRRPPPGLEVRRVWTFPDGLIYQLGKSE